MVFAANGPFHGVAVSDSLACEPERVVGWLEIMVEDGLIAFFRFGGGHSNAFPEAVNYQRGQRYHTLWLAGYARWPLSLEVWEMSVVPRAPQVAVTQVQWQLQM